MTQGAVSEERVLNEFLELVRIDSVTFEEAEINRVLEEKLRALGFSVLNDGTGRGTGNLIARLPGNVPGAPALALNAHSDTVEPGHGIRPVVRDGMVRTSGDTILGADCKSSLAALLEAVRVALESGVPRPDLELIITWGEERAHLGARALDISQLRAAVCFTLDAEGPVGTIITAAPSYYSLKASFRGRAAHAGISPEAGINALLAAARAITRMPLGRIDPETTANVGILRGGTGRNTVPALVELEGEARGRNLAALAAQLEAMTGAMREEAERVGATLDLAVTQEYPSFDIALHHPAVLRARGAIERLGLPVRPTPTNGGSDASDLNAKGLPTVVLGTGMVNPHTVEEQLAVSDLVLLSRLALELITHPSRHF